MVRPRKFTDEDILTAARAVFLEHGPGASTTLVAAAVGMSQAALFKRFGTKDRLLMRSLLPRGPIAFIGSLQRGPDQRPIPDQLVEIAVEASRFFDQMMPCLMTLKAAGLDLERTLRGAPEPPPLRARRAAAAWLQQAMDGGRMRPGQADSIALMFLGAIQARAAMTHIFGDAPLDEDQRLAHAQAVMDALWHGLDPAPSKTDRSKSDGET